jgi:aspartate/methionine/tyrosine aminotransferase
LLASGALRRRLRGRPAARPPTYAPVGASLGPRLARSSARPVMPARRTQEIEPFLAVEVFERAQALERAGADVVHLEFGEPDFDTPAVIVEAAEKAIKDGRTRYAASLGILPLREAIAEHYARVYGVDVSPDRILVTPGTSPAMLLLFGHLLDPGDEVVLSDPYYACYPNFIRYAEGVPLYVDGREEDGFQSRPEAIRERLGPRTKAVIINSPANPTGTVLSDDRMAAIAHLGRRHDLMIVSDEIYHGLSYGGRDRSILEFTDRAFVLNGFSKAFAMTGWRLGYLIAPPDHIRSLQTVFGNFFISTNEFVQWAGVAALRDAGADVQRFRGILDGRRRAMIAGLKAAGLGVGWEPTGAFYVLANARRYAADSTRFAFDVLEAARVAVTPGAAFGANAEGYLRFSYAASLERIQEGLRRLDRFLSSRP